MKQDPALYTPPLGFATALADSARGSQMWRAADPCTVSQQGVFHPLWLFLKADNFFFSLFNCFLFKSNQEMAILSGEVVKEGIILGNLRRKERPCLGFLHILAKTFFGTS